LDSFILGVEQLNQTWDGAKLRTADSVIVAVGAQIFQRACGRSDDIFTRSTQQIHQNLNTSSLNDTLLVLFGLVRQVSESAGCLPENLFVRRGSNNTD
jgi:hypothetical protein